MENVTHVHKKHKTTVRENYKLMILLLLLSKIFERLIYELKTKHLVSSLMIWLLNLWKVILLLKTLVNSLKTFLNCRRLVFISFKLEFSSTLNKKYEKNKNEIKMKLIQDWKWISEPQVENNPSHCQHFQKANNLLKRSY